MADNMALMLLGFKDYNIEGIEDMYAKAKHYKRVSLTYSGDIPAVCPVCGNPLYTISSKSLLLRSIALKTRSSPTGIALLQFISDTLIFLYCTFCICPMVYSSYFFFTNLRAVSGWTFFARWEFPNPFDHRVCDGCAFLRNTFS